MKHLFAASFLASATLFAAAASAQSVEPAPGEVGPSDDVCMAIVYGQDEAPNCKEGDIVVVARLPESDRYRIPENLRFSDDAENTAWAKRVESLEMIGAFGALSCSTSGAGGFTGCTSQLLEQAYGEKRNSSEVRFSELIAAARADRLSRIDEAAAEDQARVEEIEKEYLERLEKERDAPLPGEDSAAADAEALPDPNATPDG